MLLNHTVSPETSKHRPIHLHVSVHVLVHVYTIQEIFSTTSTNHRTQEQVTFVLGYCKNANDIEMRSLLVLCNLTCIANHSRPIDGNSTGGPFYAPATMPCCVYVCVCVHWRINQKINNWLKIDLHFSATATSNGSCCRCQSNTTDNLPRQLSHPKTLSCHTGRWACPCHYHHCGGLRLVGFPIAALSPLLYTFPSYPLDLSTCIPCLMVFR